MAGVWGGPLWSFGISDAAIFHNSEFFSAPQFHSEGTVDIFRGDKSLSQAASNGLPVRTPGGGREGGGRGKEGREVPRGKEMRWSVAEMEREKDRGIE